jgi:hypothetical protein
MDASFRRMAACAAALFCFGCLGGELDTPTYRSDSVDSPNPPDTSRAGGDTVPANALSRLYPPLAAGDRWEFAQWGDGYDSGTVRLKVLGDTVYGGDSAWVESVYVALPPYPYSAGITVRNYAQAERVYLRKSDQEAVASDLAVSWEIWYDADSTGYAASIKRATQTSFTGSLPDTLAPGAAWTLAVARHRYTEWYQDGAFQDSEDTTLSWERSYTVGPAENIDVAAGTFSALRLTMTETGYDGATTIWFAPSAKSAVLQIDDYGGSADTTELSAFHLE